ncbi:MAG: hypothetical protein K0Q49_127 [Haloplasmataceae bacterium]|nr:hypothetical protein [Haloplasmataceae bacterium]
MKKLIQWLKANKVTLSGLITLLVFFLDEVFNCIGFNQMPDGLYYFIITALYVFVGYSIKGRGMETIKQYEEIMKSKANLKSKKSLIEFILYLFEILFIKETPTDKTNEKIIEKKDDPK